MLTILDEHDCDHSVLRGLNPYPKFEHVVTPDKTIYRYSQGVCDDLKNLLEVYPELQQSERQFVLTMQYIDAAEQPEIYGWRWYKWGEYIGEYEPKMQYIYDEPEITGVYCYHIYEKE